MEVEMVRCLYCKDEWIQNNKDLTCENCTDKMTLDINLLAIAQAISNISKLKNTTLIRKKTLEMLRDQLDKLVKV